MRFVGRCFRGHDPQWSFSPVSGDGAAATGGRFNRKGEPALYLSLRIVTAVGECTQGFSKRLQPLTICEYDVDCEPVVDLRTDATRAALGVALADLDCPWLTLMLAGKEPSSWRVTEQLRASGHAGILVPSFVPGASADDVNLVLWDWGSTLPRKVEVFDPSSRLPTDQASWLGFT